VPEQVVPQLIPAGELVTVPGPVLLTASVAVVVPQATLVYAESPPPL
jgi:hypothetical protein